MESLQEKQRLYPYCNEIIDKIELSEEDYQRGQAFADGIAELSHALSGINDLIYNSSGSSLNDAIMVVEPQSPVWRRVTRADSFYKWTVTPEITESMEPLIIHAFKILQEGSSLKLVEGYSPSYRVSTPGYDSLPIMETYVFDPTQHQVAIHIKNRTSDEP